MLKRSSLAAALLVVGCALPLVQTAFAAPRTVEGVTIQPRDLPRGFVLIAHAFLSPIELAQQNAMPARVFELHRFNAGYVNQFGRSRPTGVGALTSEAYIYGNAAGATWFFTQMTKLDARSMKAAAAPGVGDRSRGFTSVRRGQVTYQIDFLRGPYDARLSITGATGHVSMADAVRWARVMAARTR